MRRSRFLSFGRFWTGTTELGAAYLATPLLLSALFGVAAGCSANEQKDRGINHGTGATGATGGNTSTGTGGEDSIIIPPDVSLGGAGGDDGLPPPWQYNGAYKDASLPDDVDTLFEGSAATGTAPGIVYPLQNSMHPNNLGLIQFQWTQGDPSYKVFRIDVHADRDYQLYVTCPGEPNCVYDMPESEWLDLGHSYAGTDVTFTVTGTDGAGGPVAVSEDLLISYSPEPVLGALYYWATGSKSIKRATFGSRKAVPFIEPNSLTSDYGCNSCHSVSRDGKVIAFAVSFEHGETVAGIQVVPTDDPTMPFIKPTKGTTPWGAAMANVPIGGSETEQPTDQFGNIVALSPDGEYAVVNGIQEVNVNAAGWPPYLELREAKTGTVLHRYNMDDPIFGSGKLGIHPEWSPDGTKIAVGLSEGWECTWTSKMCKGGISIIPFENGALGTAVTLVNGGTETADRPYHYYPSWSPDGKWIAFVSSDSGHDAADATLDGFNASLSNWNGVLRMVPADGGPYDCPGPDCIELTNGTQYDWATAVARTGKHSTWPKFAPFEQGEDKNIFFISMSSSMNYGFSTFTGSQLWMFAVDTAKIADGDPSYAPIWLPYQETTDGGLEPYWSEVLPCSADPDGGCQGCVNGERCVVNVQNECYCSADIK